MSGEIQSIPARRGTATFVPKGHTIKIINTYGTQVVDTWIFGLHEAPDHGEDVQEAEVVKHAKNHTQERQEAHVRQDTEEDPETASMAKLDPENQETDQEALLEGETSKKATELESGVEESKPESKDDSSVAHSKGNTTSTADNPQQQKKTKASWSSYIPSPSYIPSLRRTPASKPNAPSKETNDTTTQRKWSSYLSSGASYSSYLPSKSTLSAFASTHQPDPTKSYAEQLYDFSKTPVGAASISAATGSSPARSLFAAYTAYTTHPHLSPSPQTEYLSLPHTRAFSNHISLLPGDILTSNLRTPLATLIEDSTHIPHDTLTPACDPAYYPTTRAPHASCAENLILALAELNAKAGLTGKRAVAADMSIHAAPGPVHFFLHTRLGAEGSPSPGQEKKKTFVRLRAARDIVVVMSACPDDMSGVNGERCMAANFVVEEGGGDGDVAALREEDGIKTDANTLEKMDVKSVPADGRGELDLHTPQRRKPRKLEYRGITRGMSP